MKQKLHMLTSLLLVCTIIFSSLGTNLFVHAQEDNKEVNDLKKEVGKTVEEFKEKEPIKIEIDGVEDGETYYYQNKGFDVRVTGDVKKITVRFNGREDKVTKAVGTYWVVLIPEQDNTISVEVEDIEGNIIKKEVTVRYEDRTPPELKTSGIKNYQEVFEDTISFKAWVSDREDVTIEVKVNGDKVESTSDNLYIAKLNEGENIIKIEAEDEKGVKAIEEYKVIYSEKISTEKLHINILTPEEHRVIGYPIVFKVTDNDGEPVPYAKVYVWGLEGITNEEGIFEYDNGDLWAGQSYNYRATKGNLKSESKEIIFGYPKYKLYIRSINPGDLETKVPGWWSGDEEDKMKVGETIELEWYIEENYGVTYYKSDKEVIWESSNPNVLEVSQDGVVTGKSEGKATIYARAKDDPFYYASHDIKVYDELVRAKIRLEKCSIEVSQNSGNEATIMTTIKSPGEEIDFEEFLKLIGEKDYGYDPVFNENGELERLKTVYGGSIGNKGEPVYSVLVNGEYIESPKGYKIKDKDKVIISYNNAKEKLKVEVPDKVYLRKDFEVIVKDENGNPVEGAKIRPKQIPITNKYKYLRGTTDKDGKIKISLNKAGDYYIFAEKDGPEGDKYIRSEKVRTSVDVTDIEVTYPQEVGNNEEFDITTIFRDEPLEKAKVELLSKERKEILLGFTNRDGELKTKLEVPEGKYEIIVTDEYNNKIFKGDIDVKDTSKIKAKEVSKMGLNLENSSVEVIGDKVYIFGGYIGFREMGDHIFEYDTKTNIFKEIGRLPEKQLVETVIVGDYIYIIQKSHFILFDEKGYGANKIYRYDPKTKEIRYINKYSDETLFTGIGTAIIEDKIYFYGRKDNIAKLFEFDTTTGKLEIVKEIKLSYGDVMRGPTDNATIKEVDGKVHIIGGYESKKTYIFDPKDKSLIETETNIVDDVNGDIIVDGKTYLFDGEKILELDPQGKETKIVGYLPKDRCGYLIACVNGKAYIFGGYAWNSKKIGYDRFDEIFEVSGFDGKIEPEEPSVPKKPEESIEPEEEPSVPKKPEEPTEPEEEPSNPKVEEEIEIKTEVGEIKIFPDTFDKNAGKVKVTASEKDSAIEIKAVDEKEQAVEIKKAIEIKIPFKGEVKNKDNVTAILVKEDGTKKPVGGVYDEKTKTIKFLTNECGKFIVEEGAKEFKDTSDVEWAKAEIESMAVKGIVKGKPGNKFDPNANISRAEFVTLASRMLKLNENTNKYVPFKDIDKDAWYYKSVVAVYKNELVNGKSKTTFDPTGEITREEIAKIIGAILKEKGYENKDMSKLNKFKDGDSVSSWAKEEAALVVENRIINGNNKGEFMPKDKATRAETATMLYRLYNLILR